MGLLDHSSAGCQITSAARTPWLSRSFWKAWRSSSCSNIGVIHICWLYCLDWCWGEIFSLFPSTLTDTFGTKYATTNYGFLYMAQGVGSILGAPIAAMIYEATGSWMPVFGLVIGMDVLTGLLALFALKPLRQAWFARTTP